MRRLLHVAVLAASVASCTKPRWKAKVATELHIAGVTLAIPDGWRSLAELSEGQPEGKLSPDTVGMMPEANRPGVITASVLITSRPLAASPWKSCSDLLEENRRYSTLPISDVRDAGDACSWHVDMKRVVASMAVRKVGTTELSVQCLVDSAGDQAADRVCDQVFTVFQMPREASGG